MSIKKKFLWLAFLLVFGNVVYVFTANHLIQSYAAKRTFDDFSRMKKNKVGLVLGTSKYVSNGRINLYFKYRIAATVELFNKGLIDFVLVSGDNGTRHYDEPTTFKKELVRYGIPADKIYLDYAGFRTLDSVVRAKEIFGQNEITIISQQFHNERAIYLASKNGIDAIGYNAQDVPGNYGFKVMLREYFARSKVFLDILFGVRPKFLGEKISIH